MQCTSILPHSYSLRRALNISISNEEFNDAWVYSFDCEQAKLCFRGFCPFPNKASLAPEICFKDSTPRKSILSEEELHKYSPLEITNIT